MRTTRRIVLTSALAAGLLVGPLAGLALAHVHVSPDEATQGGSATLSFAVPTEKDIPTVAVAVAIPAETPIAAVTAPAMDGWTSALTTGTPAQPVTAADGSAVTDVVSRVTWTASGSGIPPEESADFVLDVSGLPRTDTLVFKVLQTYADGSVVSWIEEQPPGAAEPEYPAPVLSLAPAAAGAVSPTGAPAQTPTASPAASPTASPATESTAPVSSAATTTAAGPTLSTVVSSGATVAGESGAAPVATAATSSPSGGSFLPVVIGVVVALAVVAGGVWWVMRRRRTS